MASRLGSRRLRGYSLMELMVASVGAMAIATAVVGLSKMSETTMHGEEHVARADADLRDMASMLRNDIARAGYMASPWARVGRDPLFVGTQNDLGTDKISDGPIVVPPLGVDATYPCPPNGILHADYDGAAGVRFSYCNVANFRRLAAVRYFPGGSIAGASTASTINGIRPDAVILTANYATSDDYFLRGVNATTSPPSLMVDFSSASGARLFGVTTTQAVDLARFPTTQTMLSALFLDPGTGAANSSRAGMYRVVDDQGYAQFQYTTAGKAMAVTIPAAPGAPQIDIPAADGTEFARARASSLGGLSGALVAVGGLFNPINSFLYQLECDPTVAGCQSYALTKRAIGPTGAVIGTGASSAYYPIVLARNVVDFQVAFRVAAGAAPPYTIQDLDFSTASAAARAENVAYSDVDALNVDPNKGPHRIVGVRFLLAVRSSQGDRTEALGLDGGVVHERYCMKDGGACTSGDDFARVRNVVIETAINGAGKFLR